MSKRIGIYLTDDRLARLGPRPQQRILELIDGATLAPVLSGEFEPPGSPKKRAVRKSAAVEEVSKVTDAEAVPAYAIPVRVVRRLICAECGQTLFSDAESPRCKKCKSERFSASSDEPVVTEKRRRKKRAAPTMRVISETGVTVTESQYLRPELGDPRHDIDASLPGEEEVEAGRSAAEMADVPAEPDVADEVAALEAKADLEAKPIPPLPVVPPCQTVGAWICECGRRNFQPQCRCGGKRP